MYNSPRRPSGAPGWKGRAGEGSGGGDFCYGDGEIVVEVWVPIVEGAQVDHFTHSVYVLLYPHRRAENGREECANCSKRCVDQSGLSTGYVLNTF